jgi:aspartate kinase
MTKVFKFGGASVKDAAAIRNITHLIKNFATPNELLIVVSAIGKTTNALEALWDSYLNKNEWEKKLEELKQYHLDIIKELFEQGHLAFTTLDYLFHQLKDTLLNKTYTDNYDKSYDQIISFGEMLSTNLVSLYLNSQNVACELIDARNYIKTDTTWREGKVDLAWTENLVQKELKQILERKIIVTQGFIGGTMGTKTTTLGREGSDFSAAIFAYCLQAESVTIWKDVPGILNADPKLIEGTQLYDTLSYTEAAEMTFYGANVIHPKTIKPLANRNIPLYVKSFVNPEKSGTCINAEATNKKITTIIFMHNQVMVTFGVKDLAFITEENLGKILHIFTQLNIKINLMQSSAVSLLICTENHANRIEKLNEYLQDEFNIQIEENLQLITILSPDDEAIAKSVKNREIVLEQKTSQHLRLVVRS